MREIMEMIISMILVLCLIAVLCLITAIIGVGEPEYDGVGGGPECDSVTGEQECGGLYKGRRLTPEELTTVLRAHHVWLNFEGEPNDIWRANLCYADLRHADLRHADLRYANLQHVNLQHVNLQHANLRHANVQRAKLEWADLQKAELIKADLQGGNLFKANLKEANLWDANLKAVYLDRTNVEKADLGGVRLQDAVYEPNPNPGKLPAFWTLAHPRNRLDTLVFHYSPAALMALRKAFKEGGAHPGAPAHLCHRTHQAVPGMGPLMA